LKIGPYFVCEALDGNHDEPFEESIRSVRGVLAHLRNLEEYHILWHERPTMSTCRPKYHHSSDTLRLASTILTVPFSASYLHRLTVEVSLDKAEHLFLPTIVLPSLEQLSLCIRDDHAGDLDAGGYIMVHHLARFLNNTHRTLRSLSFETSLSTDFSPFFSALGHFPHLSELALSIPTSDPHLGDPSAMKGFLHSHRDTLTQFSLRGFCMRHTWVNMDSLWLSACLSGMTFSSLHTLNVGTSFIPSSVAMLCIQQSADTLTALDITGEYLCFEEVDDIIRTAAGGRLRSLSMGVTCLCPQLVDMLAARLPGLTKLNLRIRLVGDSPQMRDGRRQTQSQLVSAKLEFFILLTAREGAFPC
jgi:hypothetical protein